MNPALILTLITYIPSLLSLIQLIVQVIQELQKNNGVTKEVAAGIVKNAVQSTTNKRYGMKGEEITPLKN